MENIKKGFIVTVSALVSWLGILAIPVLFMVLSSIIDYATGILAGPYRGGKIDSDKGIRGIKKKVAIWLLVVVGAIVDGLLIYSTNTMGISIHINFIIASVVAVWITCNEIISILENINDMGVDLPPFLMPLIKNIKTQVEKKSEIKGIEGEKNE